MIKTGFSTCLLFKSARLKPALLFFLLSFCLNAQPPQFKTYIYIEKYSEKAIEQMVKHGIPASVIMAQAISESRSGTSALAQKSNNHFGIKCHLQWSGDTVIKHDDTLNECFRKYARIEDSYEDHSLFLKTRPRYANLFNLSVTDYAGWCRGLKNAGYATSPKYAEQLIKIIEELNLTELDGYVHLQPRPLLAEKEPELKPSIFDASRKSLKDFSRYGLLWIDENHTLIQSLRMIVVNPDEEDLAGR